MNASSRIITTTSRLLMHEAESNSRRYHNKPSRNPSPPQIFMSTSKVRRNSGGKGHKHNRHDSKHIYPLIQIPLKVWFESGFWGALFRYLCLDWCYRFIADFQGVKRKALRGLTYPWFWCFRGVQAWHRKPTVGMSSPMKMTLNLSTEDEIDAKITWWFYKELPSWSSFCWPFRLWRCGCKPALNSNSGPTLNKIWFHWIHC